MKNILTLFAFITATTFISCKKDSEVQKPQFADIEFSMYDLRPPGDTTITEITYANKMFHSLNCVSVWQVTLGLCAGVALEFRPPVTIARLLIKINI